MNMSDTDFDRDMAFESLFYLRCMRDVCKSNGYRFLFSTVGEPTLDSVIKNYLDKDTLKNFIKIYNDKDDTFYSPLHYGFFKEIAHCGHPTSDGYKDMAKKYNEWIIHNHSELLYTGNDIIYKQIPMNREYHIKKEKRRIL